MIDHAIFEAEPIAVDALLKDLEAALVKCGKSMASDFRAVTHTWEHRPTFRVFGPFLRDGDLTVEVLPVTNMQIWTWVDQGVDRHDIPPKGQGYPMRFQSGYKPKSLLYSLWPESGGAFGEEVAAWKVIDHPGIKARQFTVQTVNNHQQWWNTVVFLIFYRHGAPHGGGAGKSGSVGFA